MDKLEAIGNLILCMMILASGVLFVAVNANYTPDENDIEVNNKKNVNEDK